MILILLILVLFIAYAICIVCHLDFAYVCIGCFWLLLALCKVKKWISTFCNKRKTSLFEDIVDVAVFNLFLSYAWSNFNYLI